MATPVTMELVHQDLTVLPPDNLIAGNFGALYIDTVELATAGEYKRGMLIMSGNDGYVVSTKAGVSTAGSLCILTDDVTVGENEYADTTAYFEGEFNDERVIFPFETETDDHDELVELVREPLRKYKIFLRYMHS